jgi:hypothetical protein
MNFQLKTIIKFLRILALLLLIPAGLYSQDLNFGIISAVKHKVIELNYEKVVKITSMDTASVSGVIGPSGGELQTSGGDATLVVPKGAFKSKTTVTISLSTNSFLGQQFPMYEYSSNANIFNLPVRINIKYDPDTIPTGSEASNIKLVCIKANGDQEIFSNSIVDTSRHIVSADVSHFSQYSLVNYDPLGTILGNLDGVDIYSNYHADIEDPHNPDIVEPLNILIDGFETGQKWECVEYPIRYYHIIYKENIRLTDGYNWAYQFWDTASQRGTGLRQIKNNNDNFADHPQKGDIVVFNKDATHGHVAIVRELKGDKVHVIQQNWGLNCTDNDRELDYDPTHNNLSTFHTDTWTSDFIVTGWLRLQTATIYSDDGLLGDGTHIPDAYRWAADTNVVVFAEQLGGGAPGDTVNYSRESSVLVSNNFMGWGVTLDKYDPSYKKDLSAFASGHIKFYLKTDRPLIGAERIFLNVEEGLATPPGAKSPDLIIGPSYGWNGSNSSWQEVSVPLSAISGVNFSNIHMPFEITADGLTSPLTMDVDYVRWTSD